MEFNQQTLRPTYRLLWGEAGASQALSIAQGLKFDPAVIAEARRICTAGSASLGAGNDCPGYEDVSFVYDIILCANNTKYALWSW